MFRCKRRANVFYAAPGEFCNLPVIVLRQMRSGEEISEPKKTTSKLGGKPLTQAQQLAKIREIQAKHGFKGRA
ncbi:hypothetical protein CWS02_15520 [Enterobacter sp. EA-1]|nr:hypothetical protein CWS02_15520 [Enterobacter sp. EA-1]